MKHALLTLVALALAFSFAMTTPAGAVTPNGRLQIIHLDVAQGDGAVIISPLGQVVMIDEGQTSMVPAQLQALGVTHVDHHFASHYHSDHIKNFSTIFAPGGVSLDYGWDRAGSYSTQVYTNYVNTLGSRRRTLVKNQVITLDSLSAHPVTIKCVDLAGAGIPTSDENSLSLVLKVSYGEFDQVFGGDLQGSSPDIESTVGPEVGPVEVYKVHHHGSATASWTNWLNATQPKIGVISVGNNGYGHPTSAALGRLHSAGVKTYWTETGNGVAPLDGWDKVSNGQVIISATWEPGGVDTVRGTAFADTFTNSGSAPPDVTPPLVAVTSPVGGETWKAGSTHAISWSATDDVGVTSVDLAYSTNGGAMFPNAIATGIANSGSYAWQVPNTPTVSGRVRVTAHDAMGNAGADSSHADWTIDRWLITASAGAGGSIIPSGLVPVVEGASQHFSIAAADGYQVGTLTVDSSPVAPDTSYTFTNVLGDHSIAVSFADVVSPTVVVVAPNGGEEWDEGSAQTIRWTASDNAGVDSVTVEYSVSGLAGPWQAVARGLAGPDSVAWTVPAQSTDSALVRVTAFDHDLNTGSDVSDALFHIRIPGAGVGENGPAVLALARPHPNPGRGSTLLRFSLPGAGVVRLEILDLLGRRLWQAEAELGAGPHEWRWDGHGAGGGRTGTGLYFVRLVTSWGNRTERLVWLR